MPRKDVPLPGQGKRGRRKAWRDNADQAIAIYSLTAEEMPEIIATEEVMSQALPYWDDEAPQPQSQSPRQAYTEEEAQELVEKAYQDGWQQGMEEGYKLGKDKGYKECSKEYKEEEAKKSKNEEYELTTTPQDTQNTPSIIPRVDATPETDSTTLKACASSNTTHITQIPPIFVATTPNNPQPFTGVRRTSRDITSSIAPTTSSPNGQIVEIAHIATYNTTISSNNTQDAYFTTRNTSNAISDPYVVLNDPQIAPSSNYSNPEECHLIDTSTSECIIPDAQTDEKTVFLVHYDVQSLAPPFRTSPDTADPSETPYTSSIHHRLPPLPSMQPLKPRPYKRHDASGLASHPPTTPPSNPSLPEKPTTAHRDGQHSTPGNIRANSPVTMSEHYISSFATPSFVIHAQTVTINNYPSTNSSTSKNSSTFFDAKRTTSPKCSSGNLEDKYQAPASPTTQAMPPRDLSVLRSRQRPFSSLQRRSHRRQSLPVRGHNWDSYFHHRDFGRARGWAPSLY